METTERSPVFTFANGPSSPPMTPGTRSHADFLHKDDRPPSSYKRKGMVHKAQSPPLEFIKPIGQGPQFHFTRPQSRDASSRPSTASVACATTPQDSEDDDASDEDDDASDEESTYEDVLPFRRAEEEDISFILEYLDSEPSYDSDIEVVRPDQFEDAKSDRSKSRLDDNGITDEINDMHLAEDSSEDEELRQRMDWKKKKRWNSRMYKSKRTYSMSVEGDSSYSDNDPCDDVDESARRLRRRVRGPGDRTSLIFVDGGFPNINNIAEVEEPEEGGIVVKKVQGPPSIPSDDAFTLDDAFGFDELPFCHVEEWMEVESIYE
ncbi:hypothetical protein P171DRAFT_269218 [Karstenula rhodostoma CBS 690.94]|uniref:Uncharacterized protein n=1 Tax=Karstenula rhodostoma CBS 690.94 TaxID=1392251 RepID=A0A9P4PK24_9PLEO|nr:hypothetical protein P171DRAFT_269218 [Karstenula rhodostoma CBS 690.94]